MNVQRRNIRIMLTMFMVLFAGLIAYLAYSVLMYGDRWFVNPYNPRIASQKTEVKAGDILDRNGVKLATTDSEGNRVYAADSRVRKAVSAVVGDNYGLTTTGAETFLANYLLGFNDNVIERLWQEITGTKREGSDVVLTIDSALSSYAYSQMGNHRGAAVVMNYKTGEILASVSSPGFDPNNMKEYADDKDSEESPLVNRPTMGRYTPGSVFKIITAAAALENYPDALTRKYTCKGKITVGDTVITDANDKAHGTLTLKQAFAVSCNNTFAQIGMDLGADKLMAEADKFGFNKNFLFNDLVLYSSSYEKPAEKGDLGWSAVGQYKDLVTPLHMCMITASIANDGVMMEPKLVRNLINVRGYEYQQMTANEYTRPISEKNAQTLQSMMFDVVQSGTGKNAKVKGWTIGGKTGTAEVSESKDVNPNAWFVGFVEDKDHPICIAVVLEDAGSGGSKAAPVAAAILKKAKELGY
ncbi:MAG: peptidoglycan D,D-transpeptidase FtsI family protein [Bacillota bacterium]